MVTISWKATIHSFLHDGGEMGELIGNHDWSSSSLGSIENWPLSLRTLVHMMLTSKFPMLIFWGDELITFYNDAFRPSLGDNGKHPSSLGQKGEESWAESWPVIGPMIYNIMAGGDAVWFEDQKLPIYREGIMDFAYWTYSFSPLSGDNGSINGILVTCAETTKAVKSLQKLAEAKEQQEMAIEAAELGIWDLNPLTGNFTSNTRLKEWFGLKQDEEIALNLALNVIDEADRERVTAAINQAMKTVENGSYEEEYTIIHPHTEQRKIVQAKGRATFNESGIAVRLNGTLRDITTQRMNELAIIEREARLQAIMSNAPISIGLFIGPEFKLGNCNQQFINLFGKITEVVGKPVAEIIPDSDEQKQEFLQLLQQVYTEGKPFNHPAMLVKVERDGVLKELYYNVSYTPLSDAQNKVYAILGIALNVTKQVHNSRRIEEERKLLLSLFEQSPVGIASIIGEDLVFQSVNPAYGLLAGRLPEDLIGKPLLKAIPELTGQGFDDMLHDVMTTGVPMTAKEVPVQVQHNNEQVTIYIDHTYQPQRDINANIIGVLIVVIDITEQVKARKKLEESENLFRSLVEQAPFATSLYIGKDFVVDIANEAMINLWGKTAEVMGKPLIQALPELKDQPFIPLLQNVMESGIAYSAKEELANLVVDDRLQSFWFNFIYKPLFNAEGKVYGILNMAADVTPQVYNRKQIEESNLFARSIIDNSPVAIIVFVGADMIIDIVNQNMLKILGRDELIIGKPFMQAIPELKSTPIMERLQKVYTTGETYIQPEERIELIRYDKPYTGYYNYIYKALRNTAGEIYGIITTAVEITSQVLARKKTEEAELKLLAAIEVAELATWSIDVSTGRITYSSRLQQWLGVKEGMIEEGGSSNIIEEDRQRVHIAIQNALKPGGSGEMDEVYTIVNKQSGHKRIVHINGRSFFDTNGKHLSFSGTAQDVTVQQELQLALENEVQTRTEELATAFEKLQFINNELEESNHQLLISNEQLSQYAYVASHDLQEPLRKIQLYSGILTDNEEIPQSMFTNVKKIQDSASRMSLLIRDLLDFSRLLKSDNLYHPVDLSKIIASVLTDYDLLIIETDAFFTIEPLPIIQGIEFQIRQLFYNLIGNALKFLIQGKRPAINITCRKADDILVEELSFGNSTSPYYHITIIDNGIGFQQSHAEQIFEIFKRLHGREKYSGTGIGLALCKKIVENHRGKIYAEGNPDNGASFHIILPA